MGRPAISPEQQLARKVDRSSDCWIWTGELTPTGYGAFAHYAKRYRAHRVAYELAKGPIPDGFVVHHECRTRSCCNPAHLEAMTQRENLMRAQTSEARRNVSKTHCPRGHVYDEANTYITPRGTRDCRACSREQQRNYAQARKASN